MNIISSLMRNICCRIYPKRNEYDRPLVKTMKYNLVKNTPKEFKQIGQPDYKEEYSDVLFNFQRNNKLDKDKRIKLEKNHI